jgi:hypothetical protein
LKNKKRETINVLEKWYNNARYISSELLVTPKVSRSKIEFIYHTLKETFGEIYFEAITGQDRPIEKISWIYSLLANENDISCIGGLDLIAMIIRHTEKLSLSIRKGMMDRVNSPKDGVIFISIDDNEVHNLRKLCDEVLGEENFIGELPRVTKKAGKSSEHFAKNNDYVICYQKSDIQ